MYYTTVVNTAAYVLNDAFKSLSQLQLIVNSLSLTAKI